MTDHYRAAEQILRQLSKLTRMKEVSAEVLAGMAQAHATLAALDARTAAEQVRVQVEVLQAAAELIARMPQDYELDPGRGDAVKELRRMAAKAGGEHA